jgi:leader peptidase (prepilin peptidase)/N-methyltransferase
VPRAISWATGRSRCPACEQTLGVRDLVPVFSFLLSRGRCRHCGARIPLRYPLTEAACAAWTVLLFRSTGFVPSFPLLALWGYLLVALTWIDYEHQLLPDALTLPGTLLGIAAALASGQGGWYAIHGIVVGAGLLWLLAVGYELVRKTEGMGGGDIKLAAMFGAVLGWKLTLLTLFMAAALGTVWGTALILRKRGNGKTALPFGTLLAPSAMVLLLWGPSMLRGYFGLFGGR